MLTEPSQLLVLMALWPFTATSMILLTDESSEHPSGIRGVEISAGE
eukprot:COSAG01_NODE_11303_length_1963_cov_1.231760_1_plen_46_part_00